MIGIALGILLGLLIIILFLFLHVLDTCLIGFGPSVYETFVAYYRVPVFRVLEVALSGAQVQSQTQTQPAPGPIEPKLKTRE